MMKLERMMVVLMVGMVSALAWPAMAADDGHTVLLDEAGVKNLGIETEMVEEAPFLETAFALGRIEVIPGRSGSVSSRISGMLVDLAVVPGDRVEKGQVVARVESRQPGDPPPVIALSSPVGGMVMRSEARLGDPVEPDRTLLEINDLSEVHAVAQVPEDLAALMKPGVKALIRVAALKDGKFEGELMRFGTEANRQAGTIDAIFVLKNADFLLRPGMRAEFEMVLSARENVLSVPKQAVQGNPAKRHVYVKDFTIPTAFVKVPVRVGKANGERVEILDGIVLGDEVVTRGAYSLGFAGGGGGMSLKEALDAAHGHEHNEDGSEMTPEQAAAKAAAVGGGGGGGADSGKLSTRELALVGSTCVLLVLLLLSLVMQSRKGGSQP